MNDDLMQRAKETATDGVVSLAGEGARSLCVDVCLSVCLLVSVCVCRWCT